MKSRQIGKFKGNQNSDFAKLLENSFSAESALHPGDHYTATVTDIKTSREFIFINTQAGAGLVEKKELEDSEFTLTVNPGEKIDVFFLSKNHGDSIFSTVPKGEAARKILTVCMEKLIPLNGKVTGKNKGGFEIECGEITAFCPASQMDQPEPELKSVLPFIVTEVSGSKTVFSRRKFKEIEKDQLRSQMQMNLNEGDVVTGKVESVMDFGVFVDIGGLQGLIPASELSYKKIKHPSEILSSGQTIRCKITALDWKEDKITLSYKALQNNPWQGQLPFSTGDIIEGTVESVRHFGVFVRLPDNFNGLIPNSESGVPKGQSLEKAFPKGQKVRVMIMKIDRENEKISLSAEKVKDAETREEYESYMKNMNADSQPSKEEVSSFGKLLQASLNKSKSG